MDYEQINMGAYHLHIIRTRKFKTITVEVNFRRKMNSEEIVFRNLLKMILLCTTKNFKTEQELIRETENLYDLKLVSSNTRIGNYSNLSFKIRFLNEKYTEEKMNGYSMDFLMEVLFQPNVLNGEFEVDSLKKCKNKLEMSLQRLSDNKLKYALTKLLQSTGEMPYSYNPYGRLEDLDKVTVKNLYDYYQSVLANDYVDVFVVGDVDSNSFKKYFKENFKINTFKKDKKDILVQELLPRKRIKKITETFPANQTQLTVLCTMNHLTDFERRYVSLVYNEILGGSSNSLLFNTVREKNSYAYYVNSSQKAYDNILLIYSGIENGNSANVLKLIRKTLTDISKGKFSDDILAESQRTIIASIKASTDSPSGIINTYYARCLVNSDDFSERIKNIKKVNREEIIEFSKKVLLHTVYLLDGESKEIENGTN